MQLCILNANLQDISQLFTSKCFTELLSSRNLSYGNAECRVHALPVGRIGLEAIADVTLKANFPVKAGQFFQKPMITLLFELNKDFCKIYNCLPNNELCRYFSGNLLHFMV